MVFLGAAGSVFAQVNFLLGDLKPATIGYGYCREAGQIESWEVKVGEQVKAGQLLVKLDHARQLHAYEVAKLKAESDAQLQSIMGELKQKQAMLADIQYRHRRRLVSEHQLRVAEGEVDVIHAKLAQAHLNKKVGQLDFELAERLLEMRFVRSPIAGMVTSMSKAPGERAAAGDILVVVSDLSQLTAELPLTGQALETLKTGDGIPLRAAGSGAAQLARVISVDPVQGAKQGEKVLKVVFNNAWPTQALGDQKYELQMPEGTKLTPLAKTTPPAKPKPKS